MKREILSVMVGAILWAQSGLAAKAEDKTSPQANSAGESLKEKVLAIPPGTFVEVRMLNKQKVRGRIVEVSDDGFTLQAAKSGKIEAQKMSYDEVRSIKNLEGGSEKKKFALFGLAGIGIFVVVIFVVALVAAA